MGPRRGHHLRIEGEVAFPHSLGVFFTAVTQYRGFQKYGDEYKVMRLASYGEPEHLDVFRGIVRSKGFGLRARSGLLPASRGGRRDDLGRRLAGAAAALRPMERDLGPARGDGPIEQRHENIAASLQRRLEEVVLGMLRSFTSARGSTRFASPAASP